MGAARLGYPAQLHHLFHGGFAAAASLGDFESAAHYLGAAPQPAAPPRLWLNFAQFFYLPFLFFVYSHQPAYFPMTYGIITGAHFFPYAWYYAARPYAIMAGVLSVGCWLLGLRTAASAPYRVPVFVAGALLVLAAWLYGSYRQRQAAYQPNA